MILRLIGILLGIGQIVGFVMLWLLWGDFNSTILINGCLMLAMAYLTHVNEEAHRIIRGQNRMIRAQQDTIERLLGNGFRNP